MNLIGTVFNGAVTAGGTATVNVTVNPIDNGDGTKTKATTAFNSDVTEGAGGWNKLNVNADATLEIAYGVNVGTAGTTVITTQTGSVVVNKGTVLGKNTSSIAEGTWKGAPATLTAGA